MVAWGGCLGRGLVSASAFAGAQGGGGSASRTRVLYLELCGEREETVLLYGHLDKQPEMTGWRADLGPWTPVPEAEGLYGRGGADDSYAVFAARVALRGLVEQRASRPRCVVLIECSEESGSPDLPAYLQALAERIGAPGRVGVLGSGCGNDDPLWLTISLRGRVGGTLRAEYLGTGVHSGPAGGPPWR